MDVALQYRRCGHYDDGKDGGARARLAACAIGLHRERGAHLRTDVGFSKKSSIYPASMPQRTEGSRALRLAIFGAATAVLAFVASAAQAADGQAIYIKHCAVCHTKITPKLGDKAAWASRTKKGIDVLVVNSIKGKGKMPPQVGKSGLSNAQVKAAVEYLVQRSK